MYFNRKQVVFSDETIFRQKVAVFESTILWYSTRFFGKIAHFARTYHSN